MSTEENKAIARRLQEELWGQKNLAVADELLANTHINYFAGSPRGAQPGPEGYKQAAMANHTAYPNVQATVEQQIAEGDYVVTRWKQSGTNTGSYYGRPATHKPATITGITIDHIVDGKVVESWTEYDQLNEMQQLGFTTP